MSTAPSSFLRLHPVSIGIAHNILLARLATRHAKPAGSFHLSPFTKTPDEILEFLSPLDITNLPGFGSAAKSKALEKFGSSNIAKLREFSKSDLCTVFGPANGATLWGFVRGVDNRQLERDGGRRSVSCDINVSDVTTCLKRPENAQLI